MSFDVVPAIDVSGGKLCRLAMGGPAVLEAFGGDPLGAAEAMAAAGARRLHVVDLDLAFEGRARNLDVLRAIAGRGPPVQASGGVTAAGEVEAMLGAGADRVVLGSAALADRGATEALIERFGASLVVGVETEAGRIRPRGRGRWLDLDLAETMAWLAGTAAARFLHTSVRRVGHLADPDLEGLAAISRLGKPAIAAGGIGTIDDLRAVRDAGAEAAVVGRAAIEGKLDLDEAFGLCR